MAEDLEQGFFDRLRSLPIPRASVMAGRGLADTALLTWGLAVATALGFVVGVRTHGSVTAGLAAFGLCVLFSFAFEWLFITIGLVAGNAQAAHASLGPVRLTARAAAAALARPSWRGGPDIREPLNEPTGCPQVAAR